MSPIRAIELRSDTFTLPSPKMRKAMHDAVVGDDIHGEDPTVKELESLGASMFGKEAACYVPSGTMGNLASIMSHSWNRGQEIIIGETSHIHNYEQGGIAHLANIYHRTLKNNLDGTFDLQVLEDSIVKIDSPHRAQTSAICIENTNATAMGYPLPIDFVENLSQIAKSYDIKLHVDGARIFNAAVAHGLPVEKIVKDCDSVSSCLSKVSLK